MPRHVGTRRPRVRFPRKPMTTPSAAFDALLDGEGIADMSSSGMIAGSFPVAAYFTSPPMLKDSLQTATSVAQDEVVTACLPLLNGEGRSPFDFSPSGLPFLERDSHVEFLRSSLLDPRPSAWAAADSTRPFMVYWAIIGLYLLGEDVSEFEDAVITTLAPMQNRDGGFGGGHGQQSHCVPNYAAVLSLIAIGGTKGLDIIDRLAMWRWLVSMKQADGSFRLCENGEVDVRGAYCALTVMALLNLPLDLPKDSPAKLHEDDNLLTRLPEWLTRCQTYEGGIAGSPNSEAHGAYAFCALATLSILDAPENLSKHLDLDSLIGWLSARQNAPESGFSGRTNKLVDGCYSFWVGGCWPILQAGDPTVANVCNVEGLARYILSCCQEEDGGLRDKPGKLPDAYHSCYILAGLSIVQSRYTYGESMAFTAVLPAGFGWKEGGKMDEMFDENSQMQRIHPLFALPWGLAKRAMEHTSQGH